MNIKISICFILIIFSPAASASTIDTVWAAKSSGFIDSNETLTLENYIIKANPVDNNKASITVYLNHNFIEKKELNINDFLEYDTVRVTLLGVTGKYSWISISKTETKAIWKPIARKSLKWGEKYEIENHTIWAETFDADSVNLTVSDKNRVETRLFLKKSSNNYGNLRIVATDINPSGSVELEFLTYPLPVVKAGISTDKDEYYPDETVQIIVNATGEVTQNILGVVLESSNAAEIQPSVYSFNGITGKAVASQIRHPPENSTITVTATIRARDYYGNEYSTKVSKVIHIRPVISITKSVPRETDEQNLTVELFIYNGGSTEESISVYDTVYDENQNLKLLNWTLKLKPGNSTNIAYPISPYKLGQYILPPAIAKWKKNSSPSNEAMINVHGPLIIITKSAAKKNNLINVRIAINNTGDRPAMVNMSDKIPAGSSITSGSAMWSGLLEGGKSTVTTYSLAGDVVSLPAASASYRDMRGASREAQSNTVEITDSKNINDKKDGMGKMDATSPLNAKPNEILSFMVSSFMAILGIIAGVAMIAAASIRLKSR